MSQLNLFTADISKPDRLKAVTHFYSKRDVMRIWGVFDYEQFRTMIGEEGERLLSWKDGKQRFTPKQVRDLISLLGAPLRLDEI